MRTWRAIELVIAPFGYGELTFRHGETLALGRTLVCPTIEHAEIMFPFEDRANVRFCAPDMSDIVEVIQSIPRKQATRLARQGFGDWRRWVKDPDGLLWDGITKHVREALEW